MTWTKLPDDFAEDCGRLKLSDAAFRAHVEGILWSMRRLTGGRIDGDDARRAFETTNRELLQGALEELVDHGLWRVNVEEGCWEIVHTMDLQVEPEVEVRRKAANAARQKRHRRKSAGLPEEDEDDHSVTPTVTRYAPRDVTRDSGRGDPVTPPVTRDPGLVWSESGLEGTTAFREDRNQTSSSIDRRSTLRANRPPGTPDGELLNIKPARETVEERAHRLVADVLGKTTVEIVDYCNVTADFSEENADRYELLGFVHETVVPAVVSGSSDNTIRAELRSARDEGDITDAMFYTTGDDWKDGTGEWG